METQDTSQDPADGDQEQMIRQQSSMTYWYPRLANSGVPTPETVKVDPSPTEIDDGAPATDETVEVPLADPNPIADAVREVGGPPAFLRSDQVSTKHRMDKGSKLSSADPDDLGINIWNVFEAHRMAMGVPEPQAYYVREWLDLYHEFTAFGSTPIAAELRVFIHGGSVHDVGFYWPADAMRRVEDPNWEEKLADLREYALGQRDQVTVLAENVAQEFDGYWSVDFAETVDGDWYCIDMARGEVSWHPAGCDPPASLSD